MENFDNGGDFSQEQIIQETASFFRKVYGWMFLGLIVSAATAYYISINPKYYKVILFHKWVFFGIILTHFLLVAGLAPTIPA